MSRYGSARWACSWLQASSNPVSPSPLLVPSWNAAAVPGCIKACGSPLSPQYLKLTVLMDKITTLGFFLALLISWAPGGLIDHGRRSAAPIAPYTSLLDR